MDPELEEHYQELLKQWVKDDISIKERLDEIEQKLDNLIMRESMADPEKKTSVEGQKCIQFKRAKRWNLKDYF
jgi:hypothetical protein